MGVPSGRRRVLGTNCTTTCAYFALMENGEIQPEPSRLELPAGEESQRLAGLFQDAQALLRGQQVTQVALLLPGRGGVHQPGYFVVAPRIQIETVIRLAAVALEVSVLVLDRATVRTRLACGRTGGLEEYLEQVFPKPVGKFWNTGRGLAAMAAMASDGA
jgi:hypothetical protein